MATGNRPEDYRCNHERTNYARLCRAIVDLSSQVLRDILTKQILPNEIAQAIRCCDNLKLNASQQGIVNTATLSDYKEFDISLLYILIRKLCPSISPTKKWIHGSPPEKNETNVGDDVKRIHFIRNYLYGHISDTKIADATFKTHWQILQDVMERMDARFGGHYGKSLSVIETDNMDEANKDKLIEQIKEMKESEKELHVEIENINKRIDELGTNDPIPRNIRYLQEKIIEEWAKEDEVFVSTQAADYVRTSVKSKSLVTVSGVPGSGKSAIIHHIALELQSQGYRVIPVEKVDDIVKYWSPDLQQVFVFDDPFGVQTLEEREINSWLSEAEKLKMCLKEKDNKILASTRNYFDQERRMIQLLDRFQYELVNISENNFSLTNTEKLNIFHKHMLFNKKDPSIFKLPECDLQLFPLLCRIFAADDESKFQIEPFFKKPFSVIYRDLEGLKDLSSQKYFCLVLCLIYDGKLKQNLFDVGEDDRKEQVKREIFLDLCLLSTSTSKSAISITLESLVGTYLVKTGSSYRFLHDVVFDAVVSSLTPNFYKSILDHCSSRFLRERVIFPEMVKTENFVDNIQPFIVLEESHYKVWGQRIVRELREGEVAEVFMNDSFKLQKCDQLLVDSFLGGISYSDTHAISCKQVRGRFSFLPFTNISNSTTLHFAVGNKLENVFLFLWEKLEVRTKQNLLKSGTLLTTAAKGGSEMIVQELIKISDVNMKFEQQLTPLLIASCYGHTEVVRLLIDKGSHINKCDKSNATPLLLASSNGHHKVVEMLLDKKAKVNICDNTESSPLLLASGNGHEKIVKMLLEKGAKINICDNTEASPLWLASRNSHENIVKILLDEGANVNKCDSSRSSPLLLASRSGNEKIVHMLLDQNADVNLCDDKGASPLLLASSNGHDKTVQLLLDKGADPNKSAIYINNMVSTKFTPLLFASQNGHSDIVKHLIAKGADVNLCNNNNSSPLLFATSQKHFEIIQILLDKDADPNLSDKKKLTPLLWGSREGHGDIVQLLVKKGASVNQCGEKRESPIFLALTNGHEHIVQILVSQKAAVDQLNDEHCSPLLFASSHGYEGTVQLLLDNGADVNICDNANSSPLLLAAGNGYEIIVKMLLDKNAIINHSNWSRSTPLLLASSKGHSNIVKMLITRDADINICDEKGSSPLLVGSRNGNEEVVQILLENGADINLCDIENNSSLKVASENGHEKIASMLIQKDADVNLCNNQECSPLLGASGNGHDRIVQLLVENGAKVNQCNRSRSSPLLRAAGNGYDKVVNILLENGANVNQRNKRQQSSPLLIAAKKGSERTVKILLDNEADVNLCDAKQNSPLLLASRYGHDAVVQLLLNHEADVDLYGEEESSPLLWAARSGHTTIVQQLVDASSDVNMCDESQSSPLLWATRFNYDKIVKILLEKNADVNLFNEERSTPLLFASSNGNETIVQMLLDKCANVNICDEKGYTPLFSASCNGHLNIAQLLIAHGADEIED